MRRNPWLASCRSRISRIGYSPTGIRGLGNDVVYGISRVPLPPARITTGVCSQSICRGDGLFIDHSGFSKFWQRLEASGRLSDAARLNFCISVVQSDPPVSVRQTGVLTGPTRAKARDYI